MKTLPNQQPEITDKFAKPLCPTHAISAKENNLCQTLK